MADTNFMAAHDQEMADLKKELEVLLGPEDRACSRAFVDAVSGNKTQAAPHQSRLALESGKAIASGAIPEGPESRPRVQRRPNSKFSDGPLPPSGHSVTTTTTVTTTVKTRTEVDKPSPAPHPPPAPTMERKTEPPSGSMPPLTLGPAATPEVPKRPEGAGVPESVRPPPADTPKASKVETMSTIAGFVNLANPPSKAAAVEKISVKTLQGEFYRDRIADSVAMHSASTAGDPVPDRVAVQEAKSNDIAKAPSVATPAELVHKAAVEKAKLEEVKDGAKRKAEEEAKTEEPAKAEQKKAKKVRVETKGEDVVMKQEERVPLPADEKVVVAPTEESKKKKKKHSKEKEKHDKKKKKHHHHHKDGGEKKAKKKHHSKVKHDKKKKKKKGNEFILDDEAEEVDAPLSDEEGSLDGEEEVAENASDDSIIPDTDGEDSLSDAGDDDVDEDGNLADFVADDIEYLSDVGEDDEVEEIHGRSEHTDFIDKGPNIKGKAGRKLVKQADKGKKRHHKKEKKQKTATEELEDALRRESEEAGLAVPQEVAPPAPSAHTDKVKSKGRKRHIEDADRAEEGVTPLGRVADSTDAVMPLAKRPISNLGCEINNADLQSVIYKMLLCIAGYQIADLHKSHADVLPSKNGSDPRGQHVADLLKYTQAVETGMCLKADQTCCSVFRAFFAPELETKFNGEMDALTLNGMATRIIKQLGTLGTLDGAVVDKIIASKDSPVTCALEPIEGDEDNVFFRLTADREEVMAVTAQVQWAVLMESVVMWINPSDALFEVLRKFILSEFKVRVVNTKEEGNKVKSKIIKSYSDIGPIVSTKFVQKCGKELHELAIKIINAREEAQKLLTDLYSAADQ